ncbi:MAG: carbohydrate ABC transporter permease [Anaerolineae bacterium]|nr:carbohydrate ABC transporter permease [Anaerolineae bacterium]
MSSVGTRPFVSSRVTQHSQWYWLRIVYRAIVYLLTTLLAIAFLLPFLWTLASSFKPSWELYIFPPNWLPIEWHPENFVRIWKLVPFARWSLNSGVVAVLSVIGQVISAAAVAYGFSRFRFTGRNILFIAMLSTMMLPIYITIIPRFVMYTYVSWIDTLYPLWVPAFFGGGAFNIFLLRQFFMTIPLDFDEAAYVDGASSWTIFWRILMPLSKPAISTVAIFGFLGSWNNFLAPLIYLNNKERFTLPLGITWFRYIPMDSDEPKDHLLMAASVTITLPAVLLFFAAQRYFISGIVMSGIKG